MSVLIKGIKMPKEGNYSARLNVNRDGTALLFLYGECGGHEAKELPPHGRLIDADALHEELNNDCEDAFRRKAISSWEGWLETMDALSKAPTIIEAER